MFRLKWPEQIFLRSILLILVSGFFLNIFIIYLISVYYSPKVPDRESLPDFNNLLVEIDDLGDRLLFMKFSIALWGAEVRQREILKSELVGIFLERDPGEIVLDLGPIGGSND